MNFSRRRARDLIFLAALLMIAIALQRTGLIAPKTGEFTAIDGDSLRQRKQDYRLHGIDAVELHQSCVSNGRDYPCGQEAKRALGQLVRGKSLACLTLDDDRYGRNVVQCNSGDLDINAEMIRLGWAIAYTKHSQAYVDDEAQARRDSRGLWQGDFERPDKWRERNRSTLLRGDLDE